MLKTILLIFTLLIFSFTAFSQEDSLISKKEEIIKKGWSFGVLPLYGFDSDFGSRVSLSLKMYDFGDGSIYPDYKHLLYYYVARSLLGPTVGYIRYDSKTLLKGFRLTGTIGYYTLPASTFYGFNGYEAPVESAYTYIDDPLYKSTMYYRFQKSLTRINFNLIRNISNSGVKLILGTTFLGIKASSFNVDKYNKRVPNDEKLPQISNQACLYDEFINWGFIKNDEKDGGDNLQLKLGIAYDTRDFEPNPMKGIFSEAIILGNEAFNSQRLNFLIIGLSHRQYITIIKDRMNFLYRIGIQHKLAGEIPFYMLPYIYQSYKPSLLGLGGKTTLRGISALRIIGNGYFYGGVESRYKVYKTTLFKQNVYLGLSAFSDFGRVTQKFIVNSNQKEAIDYLSIGEKEKLHISYGGGGHIVFNENFIISLTYGRAVDSHDGVSGFYIGLDYNY